MGASSWRETDLREREDGEDRMEAGTVREGVDSRGDDEDWEVEAAVQVRWRYGQGREGEETEMVCG